MDDNENLNSEIIQNINNSSNDIKQENGKIIY